MVAANPSFSLFSFTNQTLTGTNDAYLEYLPDPANDANPTRSASRSTTLVKNTSIQFSVVDPGSYFFLILVPESGMKKPSSWIRDKLASCQIRPK
jgi:hypothetical protein